MPRRLRTPLLLGTVLALGVTSALTVPSAASATDTESTHLTGTLSDGATWVADLPATWNGTLLLFSHGWGPPSAQDAISDAVRTELLDEGYAMAGSSYDPNGSWWALKSAERDQFATLDAFARAAGKKPARTLAVGQSMGGLVNARIARDGAGRVDGALGLCGLVAGGVDMSNYQYDGTYALATLLLPLGGVKLAGYSSAAEGLTAGTELTAAVLAAQATPQGRARVALAAAFLNQSDWAPGQDPPASDDPEAQEAQEAAWITQQGQLLFIMSARYSIEESAGGNVSWNTGVDYAALLRDSEHADQVRALYRAAGLDLDADLAELDKGATLKADPAALSSLQASSTAGQGLEVPLLDLHTTSDQLVPAQQESAFASRVRAGGDGDLLRQAYVARQGHCNFTTAEVVAGVHAIEQRVETGEWGDVADPARLQDSATALGLDGAAFVAYTPSRLVVGRDAY